MTEAHILEYYNERAAIAEHDGGLPRQLGDLRWSISRKRYVEIGEEEIGYANRDNWAACRKIEEPSKRYREPTQADLRGGPIDCEVRNSYGEPWVWRILCYIADGSDRPFRVLKDRLKDSKAKWPQCRIEVKQ